MILRFFILLTLSIYFIACAANTTVTLQPSGRGFLSGGKYDYFSDSVVVELSGTFSQTTSSSGRLLRKVRLYGILTESPKLRLLQLERKDLLRLELLRTNYFPGSHDTYQGATEAFERSQPFYYYKGNVTFDTLMPMLHLDPKQPLGVVRAKPKHYFVRNGSIIKIAGRWWRVKKMYISEANIFVLSAENSSYAALLDRALTATDSARLIQTPRIHVDSIKLQRLF